MNWYEGSLAVLVVIFGIIDIRFYFSAGRFP